MVNWYCYILKSQDPNYPNITYNGKTNDPKRRLRQHNGEITGGAKATKKAQPWEIYVLITGFKNEIDALRCEWRIKHPTKTKKRPKQYCGVKGRIKGLNIVLTDTKWTSKCQNSSKTQLTLYIKSEYINLLTRLPSFINVVSFDNINTIIN
jgi:predicted GIY-YIG superfamily endonuclease